MTERPALDWATLTVGEEFGPYGYEVTPEVVAAYREAIDDHEVEVVDGHGVAPPTLLFFPFLQLVEGKYGPRPGSIHAQQRFELHAPVRVGAALTCTGVLTAMQLRRGRRYYTIETRAVDDRGVEVATGEMTGVYPDVDLPAADA